MAIFSKYASSKIDASKRRVTALWFGDVERIELTDGSPLTGTAVMVAIYTLSGFYQYYVVLYALSNRIVEIWKIAAENIPITSAPECEFGLFRALRKHRSHASSRRFAAVHQTPLSLAPSFRRRQHDAAQCPNLHGSRVRKHGRRRLR